MAVKAVYVCLCVCMHLLGGLPLGHRHLIYQSRSFVCLSHARIAKATQDRPQDMMEH